MIKVEDPKQNQHCWCGILTVTADEYEKQISLDAGDYVFLKTSRDAHFVAQGTIIKRAKKLFKEEIKLAIEEIVSTIPDSAIKDKIKSQILEDISACQKEVNDTEGNKPVIEILEINSEDTAPLPNELSFRTEFLFRDDMWLDRHCERVGAEAIRIGRRLPCLPK